MAADDLTKQGARASAGMVPTQCGLVMPYMVIKIWVNIGSGNGTNPFITWTDADLSSVSSNDNHLRAISQWIPVIKLRKFQKKKKITDQTQVYLKSISCMQSW